jgi:hypothetical protein
MGSSSGAVDGTARTLVHRPYQPHVPGAPGQHAVVAVTTPGGADDSGAVLRSSRVEPPRSAARRRRRRGGVDRRVTSAAAPDRTHRARAQLDPGLRPALRDALAVLATRLTEPVVFARVRRRIRAAVDLLERDVADDTAALVVLAGRGADGVWREHAIDRVEPALVQAAAQALIATAPAGGGAAVIPGPVGDLAPRVGTDPATLALADWRDRLDELAARAASGGCNRVVYRAAYAIR